MIHGRHPLPEDLHPMSATDWIGRSETAHDHLSHNLLKRIAATFGEAVPADGDAVPALWQWCFSRTRCPNRPWAATVTRHAVGSCHRPITAIACGPVGALSFAPFAGWRGGHARIHHHPGRRKTGRTGSLLFVTVRHDYSQDGRLAIREEQDIVYREPTPPKAGSGDALAQGEWTEAVEPTPTLLFRYSAVTFNGHRIHYDYPMSPAPKAMPAWWCMAR